MKNHLTEEEREWAEELKDNLDAVIEGVEMLLPQVEKVIEGDMTVDEYDQWVAENEDELEKVQI